MDDLWTFTVEEVAERLKISARAVKRLIASGQLAAVRLSGSYRVTARQLQTLLGAQTGIHPSKRLRRPAPTATQRNRMPQDVAEASARTKPPDHSVQWLQRIRRSPPANARAALTRLRELAAAGEAGGPEAQHLRRWLRQHRHFGGYRYRPPGHHGAATG